MKREKVLIVIRDGWGYRRSHILNSIFKGKTEYTDELMKKYPNTLIQASQEWVGLPKGYQGNSEVGHMTIGAGRVLDQSLSRIDKSIKDKSFFENKSFLKAINNCKKYNSSLHLIGLLQKEGVHSHQKHLYALLDLCRKENFHNVKIHIFTDGRDSPAHAAKNKIKKLLRKMRLGEIVTISGRYFGMDRDNRWDRTKLAYDLIMDGKAKTEFEKPLKCIVEAYKNGETDEFLKPKVKKNYDGVQENDSIIFFNFRTDRPRQLTKAITENKFKDFKRKFKKVFFVGMVDYYKGIKAEVAFPEPKIRNHLGAVISKNKLKQLRISETEKYAHVTYFFNGQDEKIEKGEDRILINSPDVATYDLKPEMSVHEIKNKLVKEIAKDKYELIVVNLVNGDMVGHTGIIPAIRKAVHEVDMALKDIIKSGLEKNYHILVFADHGNAEDQRPKWRTSHTINKVPFIFVSNTSKQIKLRKDASLKDIAPTALKLLKIKKPKEMQGKSIIM